MWWSCFFCFCNYPSDKHSYWVMLLTKQKAVKCTYTCNMHFFLYLLKGLPWLSDPSYCSFIQKPLNRGGSVQYPDSNVTVTGEWMNE